MLGELPLKFGLQGPTAFDLGCTCRCITMPYLVALSPTVWEATEVTKIDPRVVDMMVLKILIQSENLVQIHTQRHE